MDWAVTLLNQWSGRGGPELERSKVSVDKKTSCTKPSYLSRSLVFAAPLHAQKTSDQRLFRWLCFSSVFALPFSNKSIRDPASDLSSSPWPSEHMRSYDRPSHPPDSSSSSTRPPCTEHISSDQPRPHPPFVSPPVMVTPSNTTYEGGFVVGCRPSSDGSKAKNCFMRASGSYLYRSTSSGGALLSLEYEIGPVNS
jgi:hypothetical protein